MHGVVVVHGVGANHRGHLLVDVLEGLHEQEDEWEVPLPEETIHSEKDAAEFSLKGGRFGDGWVVREAYWADLRQRTASYLVLGWMVLVGGLGIFTAMVWQIAGCLPRVIIPPIEQQEVGLRGAFTLPRLKLRFWGIALAAFPSIAFVYLSILMEDDIAAVLGTLNVPSSADIAGVLLVPHAYAAAFLVLALIPLTPYAFSGRFSVLKYVALCAGAYSILVIAIQLEYVILESLKLAPPFTEVSADLEYYDGGKPVEATGMKLLFDATIAFTVFGIFWAWLSRRLPILPFRRIHHFIVRSALFMLMFFPMLLAAFAIGILRILLRIFIPPARQIPLVNLFPRTVDDLVVASIADVRLFITSPVSSTAIRGRVEREVNSLLARPDITDVTVVGHSLGGLIAYESLTVGRGVEAFRRQDSAAATKPMTLVTVGSALNRACSLRATRDAPQGILSPELKPPLRWLNLYSDNDPVTAGKLRKEVIQGAMVDSAAFREYAVENTGVTVLEHGSYFANKPQVAANIFALTSEPTGDMPITVGSGVEAHLEKCARGQVYSFYGMQIITFALAAGLIHLLALLALGSDYLLGGA